MSDRHTSGGGAEWTRRRQRGGRVGNLFFALLARSGRVGLALAPFFLFWVAWYFVLTAPAARRASAELARRLGRGRGALGRVWFAFRHFYTYGRLAVDRLAILSGNAHLFRFAHEGQPAMLAAIREGRGVILVSAHLGNWEVMAQILQGIEGRVTLVMYDGIQPELRRTMEELAQGRAFRVLFTDGSPAAAAAILSALREGDVVGMMGDRGLAGKTVRAPFLGGTVELPVGPYALAATAGAPLFHTFAVREGSRCYRFLGFRAGVLRFRDRRDKAPDLERWAAAFAARTEEIVRRHPTQWGNLYPVWVE